MLGNLPNSRPGRRSAKRERPAKAAEKAAVKSEASGTAAAKPARAKRTSSRGRTTAVKEQRSGDGVRVVHDMDAQVGPGSASKQGDPLSAVVRGAAGLAVTGVKVGGAVTKEILRRLPRP